MASSIQVLINLKTNILIKTTENKCILIQLIEKMIKKATI